MAIKHRGPRRTAVIGGDLLTPRDTAARLGVKPVTLTDWRYRNRGPAWVRVGRLIRYPAAALDAWLAEHLEIPAA
jgi:hypothetical protein